MLTARDEARARYAAMTTEHLAFRARDLRVRIERYPSGEPIRYAMIEAIVAKECAGLFRGRS